MYRLLLAFVCVGAVMAMTGCGTTREWVITKATDIAENVSEKQVNKLGDKVIGMVDEKVKESIDANQDGIWESEELMSAIQGQVGVASKDFMAALTSTEGELTDRLKDTLTTSDGIKGLLGLVILWILSKLGIKVTGGRLSTKALWDKIRGRKNMELPDPQL